MQPPKGLSQEAPSAFKALSQDLLKDITYMDGFIVLPDYNCDWNP